ncbi:MAG: hypothetical protein ACHQFW_03950 [Chitinophagales bacterium]
MTRRSKILLTITGVVLIAVFLLYQFREKIVGQFVPEVTRIYYTNLNWTNDSLIGDAALEIRNKSGTPLNIDSLEMQFSLGGVRFINLKQAVGIELAPFEFDTLHLDVNIPITEFFAFLDSVVNIDSTEMAFSLNIYYNTKSGGLKLPIERVKMIAAPRKVMIDIIKVDPGEYNKKILAADIFIYIMNFGRLDFAIEEIEYSFATNGDISTSGKYDKKVVLGPGEQTTVKLPVELEIEKPLKTLANVATDQDIYYYNLQLNGEINCESTIVDKMQVQLNKKGLFEIFEEEINDDIKNEKGNKNEKKKKDKQDNK